MSVTVPNVVGLSLPAATTAMQAAGLVVSAVPTAPSTQYSVGVIASQAPPAGTSVASGSSVQLVESIGHPTYPAQFNFNQTVISQYANGPTLTQLLANMETYFNQSADFAEFYSFVWNVLTAQYWGLDIWGAIVGVSRYLTIPTVDPPLYFGFADGASPADNLNFNSGPFCSGSDATETYALPDSQYRTLVLAKALANIIETTIPALNQLLLNLFGASGRCYVADLGNMQMMFTFEFLLTPVQYAIMTQSGVIPHPAGVETFVQQVVPAGTFGFAAGLQNFNNGSFL